MRDRLGTSSVKGNMRRAFVLLALLAATTLACNKSKKGATTPSGGKSSSTMTYQNMGQGTGAAPGQVPTATTPPAGAQPAGTTPTDQTATPATPPVDEGPKPPGADLTPERRAQVVADRLKGATTALSSHDPDTAIREALGALDADETNVPAMIYLAHAYYMKSFDDKAQAILDKAKDRPDGKVNPFLWMLKGLIADRAPGGEREDEALEDYLKATSIKPDYAAAWNNVGAIYLKRKRFADAADVCAKLVQLQPRSARAWVAFGAARRGQSASVPPDNAAERNRLLSDAESKLKQALGVDPNYVNANFDLGLLYLDADPFPGMETLARLKAARQYLSEYKRLAGSSLKQGDPVDDYLAAAQKAEEREQKRLDRQKKKAAAAAKDAAGSGEAKPADKPADKPAEQPAPAPEGAH